MGSIITPIVSLVVGGALATATVVGLVSSQTGAPEKSPGNAISPAVNYGTTVPGSTSD